MAVHKICEACQQPFRGRVDAKTCSVRCRKRLHRARQLINQEIEKLASPLSAVVSEIQSSITSPKLAPAMVIAPMSSNPDLVSDIKPPEISRYTTSSYAPETTLLPQVSDNPSTLTPPPPPAKLYSESLGRQAPTPPEPSILFKSDQHPFQQSLNNFQPPKPKRHRFHLSLAKALTVFVVLGIGGLLLRVNNNVADLAAKQTLLSSSQPQPASADLADQLSNLSDRLDTLELDGGGIQQLNAYNVTLGTLNDARLSPNVSLLDTNQTVTGDKVFSGILTLQNSTDSTTAFTVQDSSGSNLLAVNTATGLVSIANLQAGSTNLDSLSIASNSTIGGSLTVNGTTNLNNSLNVAGTTTLNNSLHTVGSATFDNTVSVTGATILLSTLNVGAATVLASSLQAGSSTLADLTVTGATDLQGNVTLGASGANTVTINGTATFSSAITANGTGNSLADLTVTGVTDLQGDVTLGNTTTNTLTINGQITTDLIANNTQTLNLGSPAIYWKDLYIANVHANNLFAAGTDIAGTTSDQFTINSDNVSADTENQQLIFYRGTSAPNAILAWDAAADNFNFNFPVLVKPAADSTAAFQVQDEGGEPLLTVDTTNQGIYLQNILGGSSFQMGDLGSYVSFDPTCVGPFIGTLAECQSISVSDSSGDFNTFAIDATTGATIFRNSTDSATAFQVQNTAGGPIFNLDTTGEGTIALQDSTGVRLLEVDGDSNTVTLNTNGDPGDTFFNVNAVSTFGVVHTGDSNTVTINQNNPGGFGSGLVVNKTGTNGSAIQVVANISGLSAGPVVLIQQTGSAEILQLSNASGNVVSVSSSGATLFQNSVNSTTAFQVQNLAGANLLAVDTTTAAPIVYLGITGSTATTSTVNIANTTGNATQIVNIGATNSANNAVLIQGGTGASAISLQAATSGTISIGTTNVNTVTVGSTSNTGTLTFGQATTGETINIGNGNVASGNTNTINIGTSATSTGKNVVTIGSTVAASSLTLQGGTGSIKLNGDTIANSAATGTTATTSGTGTNTTTVTLTAGAFANNDVIFIDNAGQDYYTRITAGGGTASLTVSPAVTFETTRTVTKYTVQNIGATATDQSTLNNRFFQGYFLGGIVTGAASTTLSDGRLTSTGTLNLNAPSIIAKNTADSTTAFQIQNAAGQNLFVANTSAQQVAIGSAAVPANGALTIGTNTTATSGGIYFGTDTNLYRSGNDTLKTDDELIIGGATIRVGSNNTYIGNVGPAGQSALLLGNDTTLYRSGAQIFASDSELRMSGSVTGGSATVGANRATIGQVGPGGEAGLLLYADTNLYRSAANNLKTDDNFLVQTATNSATAFQIQNAGGIQIFNTDTTTDSANLVTNGSLEVDTTGWTARGSSTLSRSTAQQYLGLASLSVATTAAANDGAKYAVSLASATQYSLSLLVKLNSGTFTTFEIGRADNGSTDTSCLTAQTVVTGGWTRFSCTFTTGTTSGSPYIYAKQTDATARTFFLDAVKLEAAATSTPYREGVLSLNGILSSPSTFKNQSDSTTAFQIQNAAGTALFIADTTNLTITLGSASATPVILVLGNKNTSGDPTTCTDGGIYYNSNSTQLRGCINGAWNTIAGDNVVTSAPTTNLYDGRKIKLRVGSSPYDFVTLTYNATYAKWVSSTWNVIDTEGESFTSSSVYANSAEFSNSPHALIANYKAFYDAGLRLQMNISGKVNGSAGGVSAFACVTLFEFNDQDTSITRLGTASEHAAMIGVLGTTPKFAYSGFSAATGTPTKSHAYAVLTGMADSAGSVTASQISVQARWVSQ